MGLSRVRGSASRLQRAMCSLLPEVRGGTPDLVKGGPSVLGPAHISTRVSACANEAGAHCRGPLGPPPLHSHSHSYSDTPFAAAQCWPCHPFLQPQSQPHSHLPPPSQVTAPTQRLCNPHALLHSSACRAQETKPQSQAEDASQSQGVSQSQSQGGSQSQSQDEQRLLESGQGEGPRQPPRYFRSGPVTWGSLALLLITGAGLLYYFEQEKQKRLAGLRKVRSVGKAAIGGPIRLISDEGKAMTESDLKGQWNLLYFGFTYCPDICPAELEKMAAAIDLLEKKHKIKIQPVFISIDPERDTVEQVKAYVKEFHPRMVGLTGSVEAVKAAAREFRVYYMKTEEEGDDYLVDHSIIMYLMDPKWEFVKFFGKNHTADSLADGIAGEIAAWGSQT